MLFDWLWWIGAFVVVLAVLGIAGALAWRDERVREFIEDLEALGWRGSARGVWALGRDPRVPLLVRLLPVPLLIYLASPIDLIPDFIPVIGQLDDLLVVAGALWLVLRYTPPEVIAEHFRVPEA
ncbi:MAG: DUF1232 domain-containing protein [Chloroflexi bacterium]|nr:MAG: DUF1232 domain-containing protein [Chloroflexota bacterium]